MKNLNGLIRITVSLSFVMLIGAFSFYSFDNGEPKEKLNKNIIKFSHEIHAEVMSCADCHSNVTEAKALNERLLPEKDICASCHDIEDDENCSLCHFEEVFEPMIQKKSGLVFNHKFHTADQKQVCDDCHKGFETVAYSFETNMQNPPMDQCYSCHNVNAIASNECSSCHISTVELIPEDHKQVSFMEHHKFDALNKDNCVMCHENNFCESCHLGTTTIDESNSSDNFYTPYSPHRYTDNHKQQKITRVHDLNYRFTHGIDAKGKISECSSCHQAETFCAECHSFEGGDIALEGFAPQSHSQADFVMLGVGSGGGTHGKLARRDIERCASCHDTNGNDPNCLQCHIDNDGIEGTNPKTHTYNYMYNENGDWHSDPSSLCYNCHVDANAKPGGISGIGFCGYCHN